MEEGHRKKSQRHWGRYKKLKNTKLIICYQKQKNWMNQHWRTSAKISPFLSDLSSLQAYSEYFMGFKTMLSRWRTLNSILITFHHFFSLVGSTLWYTIMFSVGKFPGCPFFIYFIFGLIDGPLRIALQGVVLKIARRKGIAMGIGGAAVFFLLRLVSLM